MSNNPSVKVIAVTPSDGSLSVTQAQYVLAFLDRVINGTLLDPRNHDNDSLFEVGRNLTPVSGQMHSAATVLDVAVGARELRKRLIGV